MTEPLENGAELLAAAEDVARRGGEVLMDFWPRMDSIQTEVKGHPIELVTEADRAAEEVVVKGLLDRFPEHGVLAEEGVLTPTGRASRDDGDYLWIVDPLDGTTNYVHRLPFFAVAVALAVRGEVVLGVVHAPAMDMTFTAVRGCGANCNGEPISVTDTGELSAALVGTGFSYNRSDDGVDDNIERLARALHVARDVRRLGSAELDLCMTASGRFDAYWELYLKPYDVAAGAIVVQEAGGMVSDLVGGGDWLYGGQVLATNGWLHRAMLDVVGGAPPTPLVDGQTPSSDTMS